MNKRWSWPDRITSNCFLCLKSLKRVKMGKIRRQKEKRVLIRKCLPSLGLIKVWKKVEALEALKV